MMTNSEIARKITQKGILEGMTLGQAFTRAIELEAGYQLSEGVFGKAHRYYASSRCRRGME